MTVGLSTYAFLPWHSAAARPLTLADVIDDTVGRGASLSHICDYRLTESYVALMGAVEFPDACPSAMDYGREQDSGRTGSRSSTTTVRPRAQAKAPYRPLSTRQPAGHPPGGGARTDIHHNLKPGVST